MVNYGPSSAFLLVGGRNISNDVGSLEETVESLINDAARGLGEVWERSLPIGLTRTTLDAGDHFYDDATARVIDAFKSQGETRQLVSYGFAGLAVGAEVALVDGAFVAKFGRISARDNITRAKGTFTVSGQFYRGVIISGTTARIIDPFDTKSTPQDQLINPIVPSIVIISSSVANPSVITTAPLTPHGLVTGDIAVIAGHAGSTPSINNSYTVTVVDATHFTIPVNVTVGGTGGTVRKVTQTNAVIDLHVPTITLGGFTNLVIQPVHSPDASVWASLGSAFTAVTAVTSERKTFTGTVQRHRAITGDWTGAGSGESAQAYVAISS